MSDKHSPSDLKKQLLGEILIQRGLITEGQLQEALALQKKEHGYLGDKLIALGSLEERDIVVALVVQCNLPYIAVDNYQIDKSIIQLIPAEIAQKYQVVPLDRVGNVLSIVMMDPFNATAKAEIQRLTGCKIAPFIATKEQITKTIRRLYSENI